MKQAHSRSHLSEPQWNTLTALRKAYRKNRKQAVSTGTVARARTDHPVGRCRSWNSATCRNLYALRDLGKAERPALTFATDYWRPKA